MRFYKYFMIGLILILVMPVVGCGGSAFDMEAGLEALQQACATTTEVQSYRVKGTYTYIEGGKTSESTLEMEVVAPDHCHEKTYVDGEWEEFIIVGDKMYTRDSEDDRWQEAEVPSNVSEAQKLSLNANMPSAERTFGLLDSLTDLEKLPNDRLDGVDCFHCRGRVDMERKVEKQKAEAGATLDPSKPGYQERLESMEQSWEWQRRWKINEELWISKKDCLVRRRESGVQIPAMESPTGEVMQGEVKITMLMRYYDINEPIKIEPPQVVPNR